MVWKPNVTVAAVVERAGAFLLVEERINGAAVLNQPAGHLEAHESLIDAVARETLEETAWRFSPRALIGIYRCPHPSNESIYLRFAFSGIVETHDAARQLDQGILRALWLSAGEIRDQRHRHRSPLVMACIDDYIAGKRYPLDMLTHFS